VGAAAASFALAQVLKHLSGGRIEALISGDLRRVSRVRTVSNDLLLKGLAIGQGGRLRLRHPSDKRPFRRSNVTRWSGDRHLGIRA
jgi:hypothetical protein